METLSNLLSYGSGLTSISSSRRPQSLINYRDPFSVHDAASPDFGPMGYVSSGAQEGHVQGFRDDINLVLVVLYLLIYLHSDHKQIVFCFFES
jgi:hypothetical protein